METEKEAETEQETASKHEVVAMKKSHLLAVAGAVVMAAFFIFAVQAMIANAGTQQSNNYINGQAAGPAAAIQTGRQIIDLTVKGLDYYPSPIRLKKGVPVEIRVDTNSVKGCLRAIQIPAFGVRKVVSANDNKIEFTPDKAGTFGFSCFMGMGKGQIVIEDAAGNVPAINTVAQDIPSGGSCGGGGCGCGGG